MGDGRRRLRSRRAEHAGHVREVEHGEEDAHAFDDGGRSLRSSWSQSWRYQRSMASTRCACSLGGGGSLRRWPGSEGSEGVEQIFVVGGADALAVIAGGLPPVVEQTIVAVAVNVQARSDDGGRGRRPASACACSIFAPMRSESMAQW